MLREKGRKITMNKTYSSPVAAGALARRRCWRSPRPAYNVAFTYNAHPDAADAVRRQAEALAPAGASLPSGPTRATLFRCKPPWSRHSGN